MTLMYNNDLKGQSGAIPRPPSTCSMAAQKRPVEGSYRARGSLRNGWLLCAVSQAAAPMVTFGTLKKRWAETGHPDSTTPVVLSTSHWVLTPWTTNVGEAAKAMSGGLQPCAKYEQVVLEPCWPMKLELVGGVALRALVVTRFAARDT